MRMTPLGRRLAGLMIQGAPMGVVAPVEAATGRRGEAAGAGALLSIERLRKSFGGVHAVDDVSFSLQAGELLALIGPNGAGKTTCFNCINGQLRADGGRAMLDGRDLVGLAPRQIWRRGVGRTFQIAATFSSMTVVENVQMGLLSHAGSLGSWWPRAAASHRDEALELLDSVALASLADAPCATLAYGDIKRVELAIALANRPRLLLMDEPTAGMAPRERNELVALVKRLVKERGIGVLFTEHSMDVVFSYADRIIVLARGKLIAEGTPAEIRENAAVREVYFGSGRAMGEKR
jgi:branched-chain amino acid transport system ATP-binding protein